MIVALNPGVRIDGYEVLGLLGAGGMGEVYRARDPVLKREVAIKVLPTAVAKDAARLQRFEQEARAAAALNHPNILVIYRFGSYDGAPYLASELLDGATLRQQLERGPMPAQKEIDIGVQIARGLAAAHEKGIVHRDLKPENLFITKDARVKILDFGLAKLMLREPSGDETTVAENTDPGMVLGTVGYMAPEQVRGAVVDHRSDIFSLGAILYEMLTGKRAFHRSTSAETMTAILNEEPPSLSQITPPLASPGLQRIVKRCVEKSPDRRFQSASDLAFALEALSDSSGGVVHSPSGVTRMTRRGSRMALWIGGATALVAIVYMILSTKSSTPNLRITEYSQLTHSGNAGQVVGTDGSRIYLRSSIWEPVGQVAVSGGEIEPVTKLPPRSWFTDVSPDGTTLLYVVYQSGLAATEPLYSLKVLGGSPRYLRSVNDAVWSADGNSILYEEANGDLFQMNADGTNPHRLISLGTPADSLHISPDGKEIRYFQDKTLWEMASNGTGLHQLIRGWLPANPKCCGAWSPDGSIFLFRTRPKSQLWALDERSTLFRRRPEQPIPLASSPPRWGRPVFSKDGRQIFCTGSIPRGELIRFDAKSKQFQSFLGGISANLLSFSKDGRKVAYASFPEDIIWKSGVDGSDRVQLTDATLHPEWLMISPDGSQVAFDAPSQDPNVHRAYVVSSDGQGPKLLFPKSTGPETDPNWSPDGHKIAFDTIVRTGKPYPSDIRTLDLDTQRVSLVPGSAGKFSPQWSPNGQFLLAASVDIGKLYVFELKTNRWTEIYDGIIGYATWSHDSRFIYAQRYASDPAILRIPAKGGTAEVVADLNGIRYTGTLGIWFGLDPTDAPLLLRDEGTSDVYALSLQYN